MCLGIPGQVVDLVDIDQRLATVEVSGVRRTISLGLVDGIEQGDWVLVHVGFALTQIDQDEAAQTLDQIKKLGQNYADEMAAFRDTEII